MQQLYLDWDEENSRQTRRKLTTYNYRIMMVKEKAITYEHSICKTDVAAEIIRNTIENCGQNDREQLLVIMLSIKNRVIGTNIVHTGSVKRTMVSLTEVFKPAICSNAAAIIIGHNHPSGEITPSSGDILVTEKASTVAMMLGITLHDHVIVSCESEKYFSFADQGILERMKTKAKTYLEKR